MEAARCNSSCWYGNCSLQKLKVQGSETVEHAVREDICERLTNIVLNGKRQFGVVHGAATGNLEASSTVHAVELCGRERMERMQKLLISV